MSGCMPVSILGNDSFRQCVSFTEFMQFLFIRLHGLYHLSVFICRHLCPGIIFLLWYVNFCLTEYNLISRQHTSDMIAVEMGYEQVMNIFRLNLQGSQVRQQAAVAFPFPVSNKMFFPLICTRKQLMEANAPPSGDNWLMIF